MHERRGGQRVGDVVGQVAASSPTFGDRARRARPSVDAAEPVVGGRRPPNVHRRPAAVARLRITTGSSA